jgi:hypothetical protein
VSRYRGKLNLVINHSLETYANRDW